MLSFSKSREEAMRGPLYGAESVRSISGGSIGNGSWEGYLELFQYEGRIVMSR